MRSLNWPGTSKQLALLAVVVLVLSAGCLGLGGDGDSGTDSLDDSTGGDNPGADDGTTDDGDGGQDGTPGLDDLEPVNDDVTAEEVLSESLGQLDAEDEFSYEQRSDQTQTQNNQTSEATRTQTVRLDTTEPAVAFEANQTSQFGSTESEGYLLNGTGYQRSEQNAQQYGSEWIKQDISGDFDAFVDQYDIRNQLTVFLGNASATLEGETTYEGERVYVLTADVDEAAINEYFFGNTTDAGAEFTNIQMTVWISADSNLPVRIEQTADSSGQTQTGQVESTVEDTITLDYSPVDIALPEEAANAPNLDELQEESQ